MVSMYDGLLRAGDGLVFQFEFFLLLRTTNMKMVATIIPAIGYVTCSHSDSLWRERVT